MSESETVVVKESAVKKYVAELIGTFVLVLMGCGSAVFLGVSDVAGVVAVSFAFGIAVLAMVYAIGGISGCHINPAVSISMLAVGKIGVKDTVIYIVAQCVGAILGAATLYGIASGSPIYNLATSGLGQNGYAEMSPLSVSMVSAFVAEVVLTFIFVLVIHGATSDKVPKGFAGIPIGFSLVMIHLVGILITGTSVNPARSLGPAVIVGGVALSQLWLFWLAPIIGGLLAAVVWKVLQ